MASRPTHLVPYVDAKSAHTSWSLSQYYMIHDDWMLDMKRLDPDPFTYVRFQISNVKHGADDCRID